MIVKTRKNVKMKLIEVNLYRKKKKNYEHCASAFVYRKNQI